MLRNDSPKVTAVVILCLATASGALAEWPQDPAVNLPICTADGDQSWVDVAVVTDGEGGAIFAWIDPRDATFDVYAQRVDVDGTVLWTADGVMVADTAAVSGNNLEIAAVSDRSGGAVIVWLDDDGSETDIRAQRIDADGSIMWPNGSPSVEGVPVCSAPGDQYDIAAASDQGGGAFVVWSDERDMPTDHAVYVQRVNADGFTWGDIDGKNVVILPSVPHNEREPAIAEDGFNGVVIAWEDGRDNATTNHDIWTQRVTSNGSRLWTDAGRPVCVTALGQRDPVIVGTGTGGAIVAWLDHRDVGATGIDLYAQRIRNDDGARMWDTLGVIVSTANANQEFLDITTDGHYGAVIAWQDSRDAATTQTDIYAQRVDLYGNALWTTGGRPICTAEDHQYGPRVARVGERKWTVVWSDWRGDGAVVSQRVNAWGVREGPLDGLPVTLAPWDQWGPAVVAMDRDDEAIVGWSDARSPATGPDVYAQGDFFGVFRSAFESGDFEGWSDVEP